MDEDEEFIDAMTILSDLFTLPNMVLANSLDAATKKTIVNSIHDAAKASYGPNYSDISGNAGRDDDERYDD